MIEVKRVGWVATVNILANSAPGGGGGGEWIGNRTLKKQGRNREATNTFDPS